MDVIRIDPRERVDPRERAGIRIAARHSKRMLLKDGVWRVPAQTKRNDPYEVSLDPPHCNCPDHLINRKKCKHIWAIELLQKGDPRIAAETHVQPVRPRQAAIPRDWAVYNAAKTNKVLEFEPLLYDLCRLISPALVERLKRQRGRPPVAIEDLVFSAVYKIFLRMPGRDLKSILIKLQKDDYIDMVMHWNTISSYLNNENLTPILKDLIIKSSLPLASVHGHPIAIDSTSFAGSRFTRWNEIKYRGQHEPRLVKLHVACDPWTHVITAALIFGRDADDASQLAELLDITARDRAIREVLADKAYSTVENLEKIVSIGATPFIPFRERRPPKSGRPRRQNPSQIWRMALLSYNFDRDRFLKRYHQRSNAETVFMMLKTNTGDNVRSKNYTAMANEVYLKIICHNIWCTIVSMYELGIVADFFGHQQIAAAE